MENGSIKKEPYDIDLLDAFNRTKEIMESEYVPVLILELPSGYFRTVNTSYWGSLLSSRYPFEKHFSNNLPIIIYPEDRNCKLKQTLK
jgi:hypothetical protein